LGRDQQTDDRAVSDAEISVADEGTCARRATDEPVIGKSEPAANQGAKDEFKCNMHLPLLSREVGKGHNSIPKFKSPEPAGSPNSPQRIDHSTGNLAFCHPWMPLFKW